MYLDKRIITWQEFGDYSEKLAQLVIDGKGQGIDIVIGIARGGLPLSMVVSDRLRVPIDFINIKSYKGIGLRESPQILSILYENLSGKVTLLVDDIVDEGDTMKVAIEHIQSTFKPKQILTAALFTKPWSKFKPNFSVEVSSDWIVFPWEKNEFSAGGK